jgi:EAL domain-containing protein (putative c-di-GMP-specific phosphodiesterase class I)
MSVQRPPAADADGSSDEIVVGHLLFLPSNAMTGQRLRGELGAAGLIVEDDKQGLRVVVGDVDWPAVLEDVAGTLSERERVETRVAVVPRAADERTRRKAFAFARSLAEILETYADGWLYDLLERKGLVIHFQPLVQYPPGRVHGYECLVRGVGTDLGGGAKGTKPNLIMPDRLFAAAGRLGMTYLLDQQACRAAIAGAADIGFANIQYFVNVMPAAIDHPTACAQSALAAVEIGGLRAEQITFEVVDAEAAAAADRKRLARVVRAFHEAGFGVSLDDVGAGGASLLPVDELMPEYVKLDGGLCRRAAGGSAADVALFRSLVETARQRGAVAIAAGIETEDQLRFAIDVGVQVTQGYVHADPAGTPLEASAEDQVLRQVRRTAILAQ